MPIHVHVHLSMHYDSSITIDMFISMNIYDRIVTERSYAFALGN